MPATIIIDFQDSRRGRDALALARSLGGVTGARFVTVTSYMRDRYGMLPIHDRHWAIPQETRIAAELAASLLADEAGAVTLLIGATSSARALHETAEREQADLIVVGSDESGEHSHLAVGATRRQALQGAPCAVALAPAGFADTDGRLGPVGIGFDDSAESRLALSSAAGVAKAMGGELQAISVLKKPMPSHPMFAFNSYHEYLEKLRDETKSRLLEVAESLPVHLDIEPLVVYGEPADVLVDRSNELGLVVVGSRAYGPLRRVLMGSVSDALLDRAGCPVMIVPRGVRRPFGAPVLHARPARSH
jgi:nucleotide-binding universal stress UspA family protein